MRQGALKVWPKDPCSADGLSQLRAHTVLSLCRHLGSSVGSAPVADTRANTGTILGPPRPPGQAVGSLGGGGEGGEQSQSSTARVTACASL